jgi:hypothetical protein
MSSDDAEQGSGTQPEPAQVSDSAPEVQPPAPDPQLVSYAERSRHFGTDDELRSK